MTKDPEKRKRQTREASLKWRRNNIERARKCYRDFAKRRKELDPEKWRAQRRIQDLKRKGLTIEKFNAMMVLQDGRCAICRILFADATKGLPRIDHDHKCCPPHSGCEKCVRGLLCSLCNSGLGHFKDCPENLEAAKRYILRYT